MGDQNGESTEDDVTRVYGRDDSLQVGPIIPEVHLSTRWHSS